MSTLYDHQHEVQRTTRAAMAIFAVAGSLTPSQHRRISLPPTHSGCSSAWKSNGFGCRRSQVQLLSPRLSSAIGLSKWLPTGLQNRERGVRLSPSLQGRVCPTGVLGADCKSVVFGTAEFDSPTRHSQEKSL